MYQFSRSMYRELAGSVGNARDGLLDGKAHLLRSCEAAVERLAQDRHYFARPTKSLFNEVRGLFPIEQQMRAFCVIERHMRLAAEYVDRQEQEGVSLGGAPLSCHATTRKGTACQREPLPGSRYCPSHKHLDNEFEKAATAA